MCMDGKNGLMTKMQNKMNGTAPSPAMPGLFQKLMLKMPGITPPPGSTQSLHSPSRVSVRNPLGY